MLELCPSGESTTFLEIEQVRLKVGHAIVVAHALDGQGIALEAAASEHEV